MLFAMATKCILIFGALSANIYILRLPNEKPYSKPLKRNVVYIPTTTLPVTSKSTTTLYNLTGRPNCSAVSRKTICNCFTLQF